VNIEKNKLLMMFFLASESMFFIVLILTYAYYRSTAAVGFESTGGPTAFTSLNPIRTGIFTLILILSSFTVWLGVKSLKSKRHSMLCFWLFITIKTLNVVLLALHNHRSWSIVPIWSRNRVVGNDQAGYND